MFYDPAILLLGTYPVEIAYLVHKDKILNLSTTLLVTRVKNQEQSKCPQMGIY